MGLRSSLGAASPPPHRRPRPKRGGAAPRPRLTWGRCQGAERQAEEAGGSPHGAARRPARRRAPPAPRLHGRGGCGAAAAAGPGLPSSAPPPRRAPCQPRRWREPARLPAEPARKREVLGNVVVCQGVRERGETGGEAPEPGQRRRDSAVAPAPWGRPGTAPLRAEGTPAAKLAFTDSCG